MILNINLSLEMITCYPKPILFLIECLADEQTWNNMLIIKHNENSNKYKYK